MTPTDILRWIKTNLEPIIIQAIEESKKHNPLLYYTPDWLASIAYRETGELIAKRIGEGFKVPEIFEHMIGDYTQRDGETEKQYHGFSNWQIDIGSFPEFIHSGDWKDPFKACMKCIDVLEGKRLYFARNFPKLGGEELYKAITASYNCGEGHEAKVLTFHKDLDCYTTDHNYSADVWRIRGIYRTLDSVPIPEGIN